MGFGTLSFQMVLLPLIDDVPIELRFGTLSFQMVLLHTPSASAMSCVLEPCHSRWFYYILGCAVQFLCVLEPCHSRWFYYRGILSIN